MGPLSLVAQEALPVEATRITEPILPGPEEPAPAGPAGIFSVGWSLGALRSSPGCTGRQSVDSSSLIWESYLG